jgi:hypothetical protein
MFPLLMCPSAGGENKNKITVIMCRIQSTGEKCSNPLLKFTFKGVLTYID